MCRISPNQFGLESKDGNLSRVFVNEFERFLNGAFRLRLRGFSSARRTARAQWVAPLQRYRRERAINSAQTLPGAQ
jgi:hypothetical protein